MYRQVYHQSGHIHYLNLVLKIKALPLLFQKMHDKTYHGS